MIPNAFPPRPPFWYNQSQPSHKTRDSVSESHTMYLISRSYTNAASGFRPGVKVFLLCYILLNSSSIRPHSHPNPLTQPDFFGASATQRGINRKTANSDSIHPIPALQLELIQKQDQQFRQWKLFPQFPPTGPTSVQDRQYDQEQFDLNEPTYGKHVTTTRQGHSEHSEVSEGSSTNKEDEFEEQINQFLAVMGPGLFLLPGTLMLIPFAIPALPLVLLYNYVFPEAEKPSPGEVGSGGGEHGR